MPMLISIYLYYSFAFVNISKYIYKLPQLFTPVIVKLVSNDWEEPRGYEEDRL
jgi:hypothetical protein